MTRQEGASLVPALFLAVGGGLLAVLSNEFAAATIIVLAGGFAISILVHRMGVGWRAGLLRWALISLVLHFVVGLLIYSSPYSNPDATTYHEIASQLSATWRGADSVVSWTGVVAGKEGFVFLLAAFYWTFGVSIGVAIAVNAVLAGLTALFIYDLTLRLFGIRPAKVAVVMIVLWPTMLYWTAQPLREAGVVLLLAIMLNCATRIWRDGLKPSRIFALILATAALATFRNYIAVLVILGIVVGIYLSESRPVVRQRLLIVVAVVLFPVGAVLAQYQGLQVVTDANISQVGQIRASNADAGSGFAELVEITSFNSALRALPVTLPNVLFGPPPWVATSLFQAMGVVDAVMWIWAWVQIVRAIVALRKQNRKDYWLLLVSAILVFSLLAVMAGNYGYLVRARTQAFVLLVPLMALGFTLRSAASGVATMVPHGKFVQLESSEGRW